MSIYKRMCGCILVLSMVFAMAACGNENSNSKESQSVAGSSKTESEKQESKTESSSQEVEPVEREHVELVLYNYLKETPGQRETLAAVNEYLKEKLNTTIDFHFFKSSDYSNSAGTVLSSGSDVDIIFTRSGMVDFISFANMNAFLPIEEYVDEYLSGTKEKVPEASWDALTIGGHLYAVPMPRDSATSYNVQVNTTMMEDLGLTFPEEYHTYYDLIDFVYEGKAARDAKYPEKANQPILRGFSADISGFYNVETIVSQSGLVMANVPGLFGFDGMGEGETVFCPYLTEDYRNLMRLRAQLVKDNIIPFDGSSYDPDKVLYKNGEFLFDYSVGTVFMNEDTYLPYFKVKLQQAEDKVLTTGGLTQGYAVSANSKHVERCLEVIELFNTDTYLTTVMRFGPEGIGWTDTDNDGMIELTDLNADASNRYHYSWYAWNLGGLTVSKVPPSSTLEFGTLLENMNNTATPAANLGFVFNTEPVVNEIAACVNVVSEYDGMLKLGQNENVDQLCDEFVKKLKDNGVDKIVEEAQKQLDTWRAANGK